VSNDKFVNTESCEYLILIFCHKYRLKSQRYMASMFLQFLSFAFAKLYCW